jgi:uncharacterized protein (DUF1330 family)
MQREGTVSAYLISQVEVLNAEGWENYRTRAARAIANSGGRYVVRGALADVIEADWPLEEPPPQTVIVAEFPSMRSLKDWYASPQYAEAFAFRAAAVKRRMIFVVGIDETPEPASPPGLGP